LEKTFDLFFFFIIIIINFNHHLKRKFGRKNTCTVTVGSVNPATPGMAASETPELRIQVPPHPLPLHNPDNNNENLQDQSSGRDIELDEIQQPTTEDYQYGRSADDFEQAEPVLHAGRQQVDEYFNDTTTNSTRHDGNGDDIGIAISPHEDDLLAAESVGSDEGNEAGDPISDTGTILFPICFIQ